MPELTTLSPPDTTNLYEQDFFLWSQTMAEALRLGDFTQLDIENLAQEVESLGRRDRRELQSRLVVLLHHLLKWHFQPQMRSGSWRGTIAEQRMRIRNLLKESPSLRSFFEESLSECYEDARFLASAETGLAIATFSEVCSYTIGEILNVEFLPGESAD